MRTFQVTTEDGQVYEAAHSGEIGTAWVISFPEGDERFFGSINEVKALVRRMIKERQPNHDL